MKNKIVFIALCITICCASCKSTNKTNSISQTERDEYVSGLGKLEVSTYKGLLPAASCPGIEYLLTIRHHEHSGDGTFSLRLTYKEAENGKDKTFAYIGKRFTQRGIPEDDNATVWQCISNDGKHIFNFLREDETKLLLLNDKFEKPKSSLNYILTSLTKVLTDSISHYAASCPGEIGVGIIINNTDTIAVNNKSIYPMMSVFKVHQALAVCHKFDQKGLSLDTLLYIQRQNLDPKTWSPMLKEHLEPSFTLSVKDLLRYTLTQSDNNASNLMFERLVDVAETDSFMATIIPRSSFQIAYTESEMAADHAKAYSNYTSPLGAAILMNKLFTENLISREKQDFIKKALRECETGKDRIVAPLLGKKGISIAHKTGSGYTENGILAAHNDVAYICLPNGIQYALAIFIKDFKGNEPQASQVAAKMSATIYSLLQDN